MRVHRIERAQVVRASPERVFAFSRAANLQAITPPWLSFEVLTPGEIPMRRGALIDYRLRLHAAPLRWRTLIELWEPGRRFLDLQLRGPYRLWSHLHEFEEHPDGTLVRDEVLYALPFGAAGALAHPLFVRRDLQRVFAFRHAAVERLLVSATA